MTNLEQELVSAGRRWYSRSARRRRRAITLARYASPLCVVGAIAVAAPFGSPERERPAPDPIVGNAARSLEELPALPAAFAGGRLSLRAMRGAPLLVFFVASRCEPCFDKLPELATLADEMQVLVVAIKSPDLSESAVPPRLRPYVAVDANGSYARALEAIALPTAVLLDARGEVTQRWDKLPAPTELRAAVGAAGSDDWVARTVARFAVLRDPSRRVEPPPPVASMVALGDPAEVQTFLVRDDPDGRLYFSISPLGTCLTVQAHAGPASGGCGQHYLPFLQGHSGPGYSPIRIWAMVPDSTRNARLKYQGGGDVPVTIRDNAILIKYERPVQTLSWTSPDGVLQRFPVDGLSAGPRSRP